MNVLSLFDGISCGQLALKEAGHSFNYYASEIDRQAIECTQQNFPTTTQLGDIQEWRNWSLPPIDLIIGGPPCQGLSFAGKRRGLKDPRSALFYTFVECIDHFRPRWFLMENVTMKKNVEKHISETLKCPPMEIDSSKFTAQNRKRLYWFNWFAPIPPTKRRVLRHCISSEDHTWLPEHYEKKDRALRNVRRSTQRAKTLGRSMYKGALSNCMTLIEHNGKLRMITPLECERLQGIPDNYTQGFSKTARYKMLGNGWTVPVITHILKHIR